MSQYSETEAIILSVTCPKCRAVPDQGCRTSGGRTRHQPHAARQEKVRARIDDVVVRRLDERKGRVAAGDDALPRAADLPDGTVVAERDRAWIKNRPNDWCEWRGTNGSHIANWGIDKALAAGARVLRYGLESES